MHSSIPLPSTLGCCQQLPRAGGPAVWERKGRTGLAPRLGQTEPRELVWLCEGLRPRHRWVSPRRVQTADTSRGACLGRHKPPSFWGHVKNRQDVPCQTTCLAERVCFLPRCPRTGNRAGCRLWGRCYRPCLSFPTRKERVMVEPASGGCRERSARALVRGCCANGGRSGLAGCVTLGKCLHLSEPFLCCETGSTVPLAPGSSV